MGPAPFIVVIDANVLYPLTLRDTVLRAAAAGFYQLRWSKDILDEMERRYWNRHTTGSLPARTRGALQVTESSGSLIVAARGPNTKSARGRACTDSCEEGASRSKSV